MTTAVVDSSREPHAGRTSLASVIDWSSVGHYDPRRITRFRHNLSTEPLLDIASLRALALRLNSQGLVKFRDPDVVKSTADQFVTLDKHSKGLSLGEAFDRMEDPGSWLAIYNMAQDPTYAPFCANLLKEISDHVGSRDPGMYGADLAVFCSSPPAFTPYHIDQHPVFFFQVRGKKRLNLWDHSDPEVLAPELAEQFLCTKTEGIITYREAIQKKVIEIELSAGEGVYWPATTPHLTHTEDHWITPGDAWSLSFNISYYTAETRRRVYVAALNELMRRHSPLHPRPYGASSVVDAIKYPLGRAFLGVRRLLKGGYLRPEQNI
ncbi:MAG TPA: cupin domain-containing protein [Polyangiaceae bacterium]